MSELTPASGRAQTRPVDIVAQVLSKKCFFFFLRTVFVKRAGEDANRIDLVKIRSTIALCLSCLKLSLRWTGDLLVATSTWPVCMCSEEKWGRWMTTDWFVCGAVCQRSVSTAAMLLQSRDVKSTLVNSATHRQCCTCLSSSVGDRWSLAWAKALTSSPSSALSWLASVFLPHRTPMHCICRLSKKSTSPVEHDGNHVIAWLPWRFCKQIVPKLKRDEDCCVLTTLLWRKSQSALQLPGCPWKILEDVLRIESWNDEVANARYLIFSECVIGHTGELKWNLFLNL